MRKSKKEKKLTLRYGTGELYGHDFAALPAEPLMPQLRIKVPTISIWGKKMAVVVPACLMAA
jgi:hypothetical protein